MNKMLRNVLAIVMVCALMISTVAFAAYTGPQVSPSPDYVAKEDKDNHSCAKYSQTIFSLKTGAKYTPKDGKVHTVTWNTYEFEKCIVCGKTSRKYSVENKAEEVHVGTNGTCLKCGYYNKDGKDVWGDPNAANQPDNCTHNFDAGVTDKSLASEYIVSYDSTYHKVVHAWRVTQTCSICKQVTTTTQKAVYLEKHTIDRATGKCLECSYKTSPSGVIIVKGNRYYQP